METAIVNEVRDTFAPAQLATASLNFGVGRSRSFCVKSTIWEERPPLKIFASCLTYSSSKEIGTLMVLKSRVRYVGDVQPLSASHRAQAL
jgi:hypothetical protein